jgi:DNA-binding transcriptional MerR regulator
MNASSSSFDLDDLLPAVEAANTSTGFPIRALSEQMGVTYRALRYYESIGLLAPQHHNGRRIFSALDREKLELIVWGKRMGFTLTEIGQLISNMCEQKGTANAAQHVRNLAIDQQIERLMARRDEISQAIEELKRALGQMD